MHLQILDLDGAVAAQTSLRDHCAWDSVRTLALRDLGPRLRLWSSDAAMREARARIAAGAADEPAISLLGSGDFHHLAVPLLERVREPFTIVHLDNHPDWVRLAPRWHCGSWVNRALRLPQVARVITLGPCSEDLVRPDLKGGNLAALGAGKLVLLPWRHAPSKVFWRVPDGLGHRYEHGHLVWRNLAEENLQQALADVRDAIPTEAVWFSIDKDVLAEPEALTNWDQGQMPLAAVLATIDAVGARKRVIGADICGEFSVPQHHNLLKRWEAHRDQPARETRDAHWAARNEATNRALLGALARAAGRC